MNVLFIGFIYVSFISSYESADESPLPRSFSITFGLPRHVVGRPCRIRDQVGSCTRLNRCRFPSNLVCRDGFSPIVCCLNEPLNERPVRLSTTPRPKPTTTTPRPRTTTFRPRRTTTLVPRPRPTSPRPPNRRPVDADLTNGDDPDVKFPGCGFRFPSFGQVENGNKVGGRNKREICLAGNATNCRHETRRTKRRIQPVIVGGVESRPNSWPWMVAVLRETSRGRRLLCGSSLISRRFVMTASHCFEGIRNLESQKFSVKVGTHNTEDGTSYAVDWLLRHPDFKSGEYYNDIALLKTERNIELSTKVFPICLPSPGLTELIDSSRKTVTVMGWGDTSFGGRPSKVLHEVDLPIVPLKECNDAYSEVAKSAFPRGVTNLFICAGFKEGEKDACQGDSGGPMIVRLIDNSHVQLGIISFGYGCAMAGYPGVYTRVSKYTQWIKDNTDL